jgi:hypothetical protein
LLLPDAILDNDDAGHGGLPNDWLMGAAIAALDRLVQARNPACFQAPAIALLLRVPEALRRGDNYGRKNSLSLVEHVPTWSLLNRALFWADVECTRARRLRKSAARLVDVWELGIFARYWRLGACAAEESAQRRHVLKAPLLIDWHAARCTGGS